MDTNRELIVAAMDYEELRRCGISLASYIRVFSRDLAFDDKHIYVVQARGLK